jgi:hypothetical protein
LRVSAQERPTADRGADLAAQERPRPPLKRRRPRSGKGLQLKEGFLMAQLTSYPLVLDGGQSPHLSRWLWLVKWLLIIPHIVVLFFLWIVFLVLSVVAFFAILFTGRYPRAFLTSTSA